VTLKLLKQTGYMNFSNNFVKSWSNGHMDPNGYGRWKIPNEGGKVRQLSIPSIRDRVVQGALKLILEPIFEADFQPGFIRPSAEEDRTHGDPA